MLTNRTKISTTLRNDLFIALNDLSKITKINKSILVDEAIELLLKEYKKKNP